MANVHIEIYDSTSFQLYLLFALALSPSLFPFVFELYLNEIPKRAVDFYRFTLSFAHVPAFTFNQQSLKFLPAIIIALETELTD